MTKFSNPQYIFLFILDAVRKDHLSLYGYARKTSPNIDKLAKQSDVYNWAFSPSSYTLASVPAILAGKYPIELSCPFNGIQLTQKDMENFLSLKNQGYKLAMFTANIVTSHYQTNLYKFFDYFWDELTEIELNRKDMLYQKAEVVIKAVKEFILKNKNDEALIVIHLMEAHGPYTPWIESIFEEDYIYKKDKRKIERVVNDMFTGVSWELVKKYKVAPKYQLLNLVEGPNGEIEDFNPNINEYIAKYDMGIYLMDKELGNFFQFLEKEKIFDSSKIIITADHGELLGEENIFFAHGSLTHPVLANVPLVIKNPYQKEEKIINENYSLTSLFNGKSSNKPKKVFMFHPQSFSFLDNEFYITIHNGQLSHQGSLYQNIFPTSELSFSQILDNFVNFEKEIIIKFYKRDLKKLNFKEIKEEKSIDTKLINIFFTLQTFMFKNLKNRINNEFEQITRENLKLKKQITQTQNHIKNLETQLKTIKSSEFFKLWQSYCKIRDKIFGKKNENKKK
ncbi:MAG: hypothetical protein KatS3mg093_382 [Candidatus Parcubacteria bacterium]|nr:MAG: hypothetical protein KatS3mg093_382 [Candidatus Parcubacteria bacterium]